MSSEPIREHPDAEVAIPDPAPPDLLAVPLDTSYEVELGDPPAHGTPVYVDVTTPAGERLPVIPPHLRTAAGVKAAARYHAGRHAHRAAYHSLRSPRYLLLALFWSVVGVFRLIARQIAWWHLLEQHGLRSQAAADGDSREWSKLHKQAQETRKVRGIILGFELAGLAVAAAVLARYSPWWGWLLVACVVLPLLARHGRPADRRDHLPGNR